MVKHNIWLNEQVEVWAEDIGGIIYWVDGSSNVYLAEDIEKGVINPRVIAKWSKEGEKYVIV